MVARADMRGAGAGQRLALALLGASVPLAGATTLLILAGHRIPAGLTALAAAAALVVAATRLGGGPRQRLAERVLDRVYEASILAPLAWVLRAVSDQRAVLALVGLGASYLASYQRARGHALGYHGTESVPFRLTRYSLLVFGLLTGWLLPVLWAFVVLTVAAAAARAWSVADQDRRTPEPHRALR